MKLNLFLLSILAVLYLSKAGPLRLHKRAAFYIANETACVVDNIVYSNGDPIPTDDPCESCKCRPPGFACVLKECRVKPGCRAVRHEGHCCPEYVCGCEHNGRMYRDGDEIRDPKNPCYTCHCQGTSIACAFVDCFFRIDCIPMYEPGECCPSYRNCSASDEDTPSKDPFAEDNALPPLNLLPALNDDSILPGDLPLETKEQESSEKQTDPPQITTAADKDNEQLTEVKVTDESSRFETTVSAAPVTEDIKELNPETEEKSSEIHTETKTDKEKETEIPNEESVHKNEDTEETKLLFNSNIEIKTDDNIETTTIKEVSEDKSTKNSDPTEDYAQEIKGTVMLTTVLSGIETIENEAKAVTEKVSEVSSTSTEVPVTEKQVQNSAADNSKSLKLSDDEKDISVESSDHSEKSKEEALKPEENLDEARKTTNIPAEELPSKVDDSKDSTKNKSEAEENVAEESQSDPQIALFYNNDDRVINKESAETVTIVVHVKDKTKPPTETDFVAEEVTSESSKEVTQDNLLKFSDELKNTEESKESTKKEESESTGKNFEAFPDSSTQVNKDASSTNSPVTNTRDEEKVEARSEESDTTAPTGEKQTSESDLKNDLPEVTTQNVNDDHTELNKEARANEEITEEKKEQPQVTEIAESEPKVTEIAESEPKETEAVEALKLIEIRVEQSGVTINIKPASDSGEEKEKIEETKEEEPEKEEKTAAAKSEVTDEPKPKVEEESNPDTEESKSEAEEPKQEERAGEIESENNSEESQPEEKVEDPKADVNVEENKSDEKTEESKPEERAEETEEIADGKTNEENAKPEDKHDQPKETTEQGTEAPNQTDAPKDNE